MRKIIYLIHKIGGAGLMLPYVQLLAWVRYILNDKKPNAQIIIVVSALEKVTRMLQDIFEKKLNGDTRKALEVFQNLKKIHLQRCRDLKIKDLSRMYDYFYEIEFFIRDGSINKDNHSISKAQLLKFGELISAEIFYQFLLGMNIRVKLIDAQEIIYADGEDYCNSVPVQPKTSQMISEVIQSESMHDYDVILTEGYICKERLLGLDGSDLTAGLVPVGLQSYNSHCDPELILWKDVDGVIVNGIVKEEISFPEYLALETTPVRKDAIIINQRFKTKIRIRSFKNLNHPGTRISWK
jgi:aspartokinase